MKLHKILLCLAILALASCNRDKDLTDKTPLTVTALLDVNSRVEQTRAVDKEFANGDQMVFYLRHVEWNGGFTTDQADVRTSKTADQAPRLITLTCTGSQDWNETIPDILPFDAVNNVEINKDNTKQAAGLLANYTNTSSTTTTGLYWDDFSNASSTETDLHTEHHYLQSYYGYCYNGGTPNAALVNETGVLGWAVQTNQTLADDFKHSDLLWSAEQTPVSYAHRDANVDINRAGLIIPYTHAMSKVTINVIAGNGFADNYNFAGTGVKLDQVRISCEATAPTATLSYTNSTKNNVIMQPGTGTGTRSFQAIIVPSVLTVGNKLASITGMDGNEYFIYVTDNIIAGWNAQLTDTDEDIHEGTAQVSPRHQSNEASIPAGSGHQMKSGVNYVLNVTVNKTEISVYATILDWNEVMAEGEGEIFFEHDVKDGQEEIVEALKAHGFDVYKSTDKNNFGTKATSLRWNRTSEKWKYNPAIYWLGGVNEMEYFRALSNVKADALGTPNNESLAMENGRDALWGTTPAHNGTYADGETYTYAEGAALAPRTGKVPLLFYHAMAKITINLEDYSRNNSDPSARLDLHGATIQLTNLATGGTIELDKGAISPSATVEKTFSEDRGAIPSRMGFFASKENGEDTHYNANVTVRDYFITPQTIGDEAQLIVTLANGTTYRTKLNQCKVTNTPNLVSAWERNKHYIYSITLAKDQIMFRAEIKEWEDVYVSGTITPEW